MEDIGARGAKEIRRVTLWGMAFNIGLSVVKLLMGVLGKSQALVADAAHSLSDTVTDVAVIAGVHFWSAPADADHPHGHGRIEMVVTLFIGILLALVGLGLIFRAISTLHESRVDYPTWLAFYGACLSIVIKEALYWWTRAVGRRVRSPAMMANAWHHRSDALSSIPVALAVLGSHMHPKWVYLDQIGAVVVSLLIIHAAWRITWPALRQLTDIGATEEERRRILAVVKESPEVQAVHALRTRYIGASLQVDVHVMVDAGLTVREGHAIAGKVKDRLLQQCGEVTDVLIHIEPFDAFASSGPGVG
jgi:cation diffusion facilitator family transporter